MQNYVVKIKLFIALRLKKIEEDDELKFVSFGKTFYSSKNY